MLVQSEPEVRDGFFGSFTNLHIPVCGAFDNVTMRIAMQSKFNISAHFDKFGEGGRIRPVICRSSLPFSYWIDVIFVLVDKAPIPDLWKARVL